MPPKPKPRAPRRAALQYLDLFSGCGGFSLGLKRAGLKCVAAVDFDPQAINTFKANFPQVKHVLERDLTKFTPEDLRQIIGAGNIDVIVGGPPCQGFSKARMVGGSNHGSRLIDDPRRSLFKNYLHYVEYFRPLMFVMENVPGIRSAAGGDFFVAIQNEARKLGYRVHAAPIRAWDYGVPQKRERQLIIGTSCDLPTFSTALYVKPTHGELEPSATHRRSVQSRSGRGRPRELSDLVTLWEAIGDLPTLQAGEGRQESEYDLKRREKHILSYGRSYLDEVAQVHRAKVLTGHVARNHSDRDLRDFERLKEGETSLQAIARGEKMEFPYDRENFKDRYTRQRRNGLCSTIVAHLSKDGLMFIHPTQRRSLTVREAARIQSFPDWFAFPKAKTAAFRVIGNAVPPRLGEAIGSGIKKYLSASVTTRALSPMPDTPKQAAEWLSVVVSTAQTTRQLRVLPLEDLKKAWFSIGFLNSWLHPDNASDRGHPIVEKTSQPALLAELAPGIAAPIYASSGWPVQLVAVARETERRFRQGDLRFDEYYYSQAQLAGWAWWQSKQLHRGRDGAETKST